MTTVDHDAIRLTFKINYMNNNSHTILNSSRIAVYRLLNERFSGCRKYFSQEDINDIVSDTVFKACRSFHCFNPDKAQLSTWISRIALNCVKDAIAASIRRQPISCSIFTENPQDGSEYNVEEYFDKQRGFIPEIRAMFSEYDAEKELEQKEFEQQVDSARSELSEKNQRFANWLVQGYSPREIAEMEGCTPNAASKRAFDIRKALKEPLSAIADEYEIYGFKKAS